MNNPIMISVDHNPFGSIDKLLSLVAGVGFAGMEWLETGPKEVWSEPAVAEEIRSGFSSWDTYQTRGAVHAAERHIEAMHAKMKLATLERRLRKLETLASAGQFGQLNLDWP